MKNLVERYGIVGRSTPYRPDNPVVELADISIGFSRLKVELKQYNIEPFICTCDIWEHTIHELETLAVSLKCAAEGAFPPKLKIPRPESRIGTTVNLPLAVDIEVGYSLEEPGAIRARFLCSSLKLGSRDRSLGVMIGVAVAGGYGEVIAEPKHVVDLAEWIDDHILRLHQRNESPTGDPDRL